MNTQTTGGKKNKVVNQKMFILIKDMQVRIIVEIYYLHVKLADIKEIMIKYYFVDKRKIPSYTLVLVSKLA